MELPYYAIERCDSETVMKELKEYLEVDYYVIFMATEDKPKCYVLSDRNTTEIQNLDLDLWEKIK